MSSNRKIWTDGEGVVTPELQRVSDIAASADDRVYDVLLTPGSTTKKVMPLVQEPGSTNTGTTFGLCIPSSTNGKVTVQPSLYVATDSLNPQKVLLAGTLYAAIDSATAIATNSTGSTRYDLIYATMTRSISATASRHVKTATDASVSLQTLNVQDSPTITIGINQGFVTGAFAPTTAQVNAALPADSSTAYSFPIAYVTVTNSYSSGAPIAADVADAQFLGAYAYLAQAWPGGWIHGHRIRGMRPTDMNEGVTLTNGNDNPGPRYSERWGSDQRVLLHLKVAPGNTPTVIGSANILDMKYSWANRLVFCVAGYLGSAATDMSSASFGSSIQALTGGSSPNCTAAVLYTGGSNTGVPFFNFTYGTGGPTISFYVGTYGWLYYYKSAGSYLDATHGDQIALYFIVSDRLTAGM